MSDENNARDRLRKSTGRRSSILKRQDTCYLADATETESTNTILKRRVSFASTATVRTFEALAWQSHMSDDSGSSSVNHIENDVFEPRSSLLLNVKPQCPSVNPPVEDNSTISPQANHLDVKEQDKTIVFSQLNESGCDMDLTTNVSQLSHSYFGNENTFFEDDNVGTQRNRFVLDVTNDSEPHVIFPWNDKGTDNNDVEKTHIFLSSDDNNMEVTRNFTGFPSLSAKFHNTEYGSDNLHQEHFSKQSSGNYTMADDMTADMEMTDIIETVSVPKRRSVLVDLTENKDLTPIEKMSVSSIHASVSDHELWAQENNSLNFSQVCARLEALGADKSKQSVVHNGDDEDSLQNSISLSEIAGLKSPQKQSNIETEKSTNEMELESNTLDNSVSFIGVNNKRSPSGKPSSCADENVSKQNTPKTSKVVGQMNTSVDVEKKISLHCNHMDEGDCRIPKDAFDNVPMSQSVQEKLERSIFEVPRNETDGKDARQAEDNVWNDVFEPSPSQNSHGPSSVNPPADNPKVTSLYDRLDVKQQEKTIMFSQFNESACDMDITTNVSELPHSCFNKENSFLEGDKSETQHNRSSLDVSNDSKPRVIFPWNDKGTYNNVEKTHIFASSDDNNMEFTRNLTGFPSFSSKFHNTESSRDIMHQDNFPKQSSRDYTMADDMTADMEMTDIIETVSVPKRRSVLVDLTENKNLTPIQEMSVCSMYASVSEQQSKSLNFSQVSAKLEALGADKNEQSVIDDGDDEDSLQNSISLSEIAGLKSLLKQSNTETDKSVNVKEMELSSIDNSISFIGSGNKRSPSDTPSSCADENVSNQVVEHLNKSMDVEKKIIQQQSTSFSEQTKKREALRKSLCDQMMFPNLASKSFNSKPFSYLTKPNTVKVARIDHNQESTPNKPGGAIGDKSGSKELEENKTVKQPRLENMRLSSDFFEGEGLLDEGDCPTLEDAFDNIPLNDSVQEELVFSYMRSIIEVPGDEKDGKEAEDVVRETLEFSDICQDLGIEYNSEQRNTVITKSIPNSSAYDKLNASLVKPQITTLEKYVGQLHEEYSRRQKTLKDSFRKFSCCPIYKDVKIATKQGLDVSAIKAKAQDMGRACKRSSYSKQNRHRAEYLMELTLAQQKGHDQQKKNLETILSDIERVANVSAEIDKRLEDLNVFSETKSENQQLQRETVQIESETCQMRSQCDKLYREIEVLNKVSRDRLHKIKDDEEEELILRDKISFMSCLSEWSLLKQSKTKWSFGFLSNTIVLDVNLSDTKTPHQRILDIFFRSRLSSKSTLWARISHQLLLSSLDKEALIRRFKSLNLLVSHVSDLAGVSRDLCAELKDVHLKHHLEGKGLRIRIQLLRHDCQQAIEVVTTLQPGSYTTQPLDWEASVVLSSLSSTSVVDALKQVKPGPKYITRSLEAVLSLMAG